MSARPSTAATAAESALEVRFEKLTPEYLDALLDVEFSAYSHPWTRGNFTDALTAGYKCQLLMAGDHLLGYFCGDAGGGRSAPAQHHRGPRLPAPGLGTGAARTPWPCGHADAGRSGCGWKCAPATCAPSRCTKPMASAAWANATLLPRRAWAARRRRGHEPAAVMNPATPIHPRFASPCCEPIAMSLNLDARQRAMLKRWA